MVISELSACKGVDSSNPWVQKASNGIDLKNKMKGFNSQEEYLMVKNGVTHKSFKIEPLTCILFCSTPLIPTEYHTKIFYIAKLMQLFMLG